MIVQNLHTHTCFCDGKNTPEEMVLGAISLGCRSLGFSGHAPLPVGGEGWAMNPDQVPRYRREVLDLREKYAGQLDIYLGLEQDIDSPPAQGHWDYLIGSVHNLTVEGTCFSVDDSATVLRNAVLRYFDGDPLALAEAYYRKVSQVAEVTGCQIVGHFDLLTKFNEDGTFFNEESPRYRKAALSALDALSGQGLVFEINTGAISRGYRTTPYPAPFLLRELSRRGESICITSDSHSADTILYGFSQAAELARSCGFKEAMVLTRQGFIPQELV